MKSLPRISVTLAFFVACLSYASAQGEVEVELINAGSTWKYLDNGSDQGTTWQAKDFIDSSWPAGPAELGFGDGGEATVMTKGPSGNQHRTFYFRHAFNVTAGELNSLEAGDDFYQLVFSLMRDDGAVVYLNGQEQFRDAMPVGSVNYMTLANQTAGGATESTFFEHVVEGTGKLVVGTNVVAVEVHQATAGSSDVSFDMGLKAVDAAATYGSFHPPQRITFEEAGQANMHFYPNLLQNDDLGWEAKDVTTGGLISGVFAFDPGTGEPFDGFVEGNSYATTGRHARLSSQLPGVGNVKYRIDLRNYTNVKVAFDVKAIDSSSGFETGDYIKFSHLTSNNGSDYKTTEALYLQGGGGGGGGGTTGEVLVAEAAPKRALVPTSNIGTTWLNLGYNDASWLPASGGVGYERSSSNTYNPYFTLDLESRMYNKNETVYIRIPFNVTDSVPDNDDKVFPDETELFLGMRYDDGFIAYINGQKVLEKNPPAGTPTWNSAAPTTHADGEAVQMISHSLTAHLDKLQVGDNLLAIHGLNKGKTSSDFLISCLLEVRKPGEIVRNDPPLNLIDLDRGPDGPYYRYEFDVDSSINNGQRVNSYAFVYDAKADSDSESLFFDNFQITGDPIAVDSYGSYIYLETSLDPDEDGLEFADPDGDGIVNYFEFAFRGDPEKAELVDDVGPIMPQVRIVTDTGGQDRMEISWRQLNVPTDGSLLSPYGGFSLYDIKYIPQWSTDGVNWNDAATGANSFIQIGEAVPNVETPEQSAETVTVTAQFIDAIPLTDPGSGEFIPLLVRLKVESYKLILP